jgi:hypothetical protein
MSYASELKAGKLTVGQFLKKSAGWIARLAGFTDAKVDELVARADLLTDEVEDDVAAVFSVYIAQAFPIVPAKLREAAAIHAAQLGMKGIDMVLAGLGEELKKLTPDA